MYYMANSRSFLEGQSKQYRVGKTRSILAARLGSFSQSDHTIRLHTEFKVAWLAEE